MTATLPLLAVISIATVCDLMTRRIPNALLLLGLFFALLLAYVNGGISLLLTSVLGSGVGFLSLIYPYSKSLIGAGDVKLMAVVGAFLGPYLTLLTILYASIFGGLIIALYLAYKGLLMQSVSRLFQLNFSSLRIPYAFAISLGACLALLNPNYL